MAPHYDGRKGPSTTLRAYFFFFVGWLPGLLGDAAECAELQFIENDANAEA